MDASTLRTPVAADGGVDRSLVIRNLRKEYRAGEPVLKDVSLDDRRPRHDRDHRPVRHRQVDADPLHQPAGRSDLGRNPVSAARTSPRLEGRALRMARRRIGMVFQEYNLVERLSVIENVLCGRLGYVPVWRAWLRKFPAADIERAFQLLDAVGLGDFATQRADQLSGGQRQRVGIARALMQEPDLMLADEPTSSLDPKTSVEIMELIAQRAGERDIPVIVNIHNVELARRFADRIVGMSKGEIVFDGPPRALEDAHLLGDLRRRRVAGMSVAALPSLDSASPSRRTGRRASRCLVLALYVVYASTILDITWARFVVGLDQGARFISRMFPPDFAPDKLELLYSGMIESLQIAILATVVGVLLSLPLGLAAARNLAPLPLAWTARALIALFRTFHPVIVAILFVKAVGFGALAGMLALIVASLGFLSKLVAEAVEEMSMKQVEAVRATGSPFLSRRDHGRAAAGDAALHRLFRLSARFQPAQLRARRPRRRRRHRRDPVHRVPALRLRLRAHHRARHHRGGDDRRDRLGLDAEAVPMSAPPSPPDPRAPRCAAGSASPSPSG